MEFPSKSAGKCSFPLLLSPSCHFVKFPEAIVGRLMSARMLQLSMSTCDVEGTSAVDVATGTRFACPMPAPEDGCLAFGFQGKTAGEMVTLLPAREAPLGAEYTVAVWCKLVPVAQALGGSSPCSGRYWLCAARARRLRQV